MIDLGRLEGKKMSVKRRRISQITVGANAKPVPVPVPPPPTYGLQHEQYREITRRVVSEPYVTKTVDALQNRLRMLQLMLDDCSALIEKKNALSLRRKRRLHMRRSFVLITWFFLTMTVLAVVVKISLVTAQDLSLEQVAEFRAAFDHFDEDEDGKIRCKELKKILASLDPQAPGKAKTRTLGIYLRDNEFVDFDLFLKIVAHRLKDTDCEDEIREVFQQFDKDGDGTITAVELRHMLLTLGERLSEEQVDSMMREVDADANGKIDYEEFVKVMIRK